MAEDAPLSEKLPWPRALRSAARTHAQLAAELAATSGGDANADDAPLTASEFTALSQNFAVQVPQRLAARLKDSRALRKQFLPQAQELIFYPEELTDPIGDEAHSPVPGLTHRYPDRVLLKLTHHCAVYCRFCFRREKVSKEPMLSADRFAQALAYIQNTPSIWEVILTGGDPLILTDQALARTLKALAEIPHVQCVRFHTRIPTALPERITPELLNLLTAFAPDTPGAGLQPWMVVHINSADELDPATSRALRDIVKAGIPMLSQSVLLRGVNDTPEQLEALFRGLVARGIKPYYLHTLDLARGTEHFRVALGEALSLYDSLRARMSGTCIPQLILDIPGGLGKIAINSENLRRVGTGESDSSSGWLAKSPLTGEWVPVNHPSR